MKTLSSNLETKNDTTGVVAEWAGFYINKFELENNGKFRIDSKNINTGTWNLDEEENTIVFQQDGHPENSSSFNLTLQEDSLYLKDSYNLIKCVRSSW